MSDTSDALDQFKLLDVGGMDDASWRRLMWNEVVELRKEAKEIREEGRTERANIWAEQKKTNGSVRALERWRDRIIGAVAVLTLFVVPIIGWIIYLTAQGSAGGG